MILIPLSIEKCVFSCRFGSTALPSGLLHTHQIVTYISTVPSKLSLGSPLYTNSLHSLGSFIQRIRPGQRLYRSGNKFIFFGEGLYHAQPPSWRTTPCRLSATGDSIYFIKHRDKFTFIARSRTEGGTSSEMIFYLPGKVKSADQSIWCR
jgi:hypothetical protein